ncbi:MAG: hypothetical protein Fues2KO_38660 [Fuerstiella sp.]
MSLLKLLRESFVAPFPTLTAHRSGRHSHRRRRLRDLSVAHERLEDKTLLAAISGFKWEDNGNLIRETDLVNGNYAVFVIDVSQSTTDPFSGTETIGDVNDDGLSNTVLDAQLAAFIALNQHLVDLGLGSSGQVSIVIFSAQALELDMNPTLDGHQRFAAPLADVNSNNERDVEDVLKSIKLDHGLGNSTNYEAPLQRAASIISGREESSSVIFLSDGTRNSGGAYSDEVSGMRFAGANLRAFGVGDNAQLADLQVIDPQAAIFTSTQDLLGVFRGGRGGNDTGDPIVNWREPGLPGWEIYVDLNNNYRRDPGEPFDITDGNGDYTIVNVPDGTHIVREVSKWGWRQLFPGGDGGHEVKLAGEDVTGINFGNKRRLPRNFYVSDIEGILGVVEVPKGEVTLLGDMGVVMTDIAIATNGGFYGVTDSELYRINPDTAKATLVGQLGIGEVTSLDFGPEDTLYAVRQRSVYTIDINTGEATFYANMDHTADGDIAFQGNTMFVSTAAKELVTFDIETLQQRILGPITDETIPAMDFVGDELIGVYSKQLLSIHSRSGEGFLGPQHFGAPLSRATGAAFGNPRNVPPPPVRGTIQGQVWNDLNENGRKENDEQPFRGVEVYLDLNNNGVRNNGEPTTFSDNEGRYEFTNLPTGDYVVRQTLSGGDIQTFPQGYLASAYFSQSDGTTTLVEITSGTGAIVPIGATGIRMHGIARTNIGDIFGINFGTDTVYRIDPVSGQETAIGVPGAQLTGGLTYVSETDTLYTVARFPSDVGHHLMKVDQVSGALTPVGEEVSGINGAAGLAWDWHREKFVLYDNFDDEFYEFDVNGIGQKISDASPDIPSWSLAFNGSEYLMGALDNPGRIVRIDPQTGLWQQAFNLAEPLRLESLDYSRNANVPHRVSITTADPLTDLDFGRKGPPRDLIVTQSNNTVVTEAGGTDSFVVRLASQPTTNVVLNITVSDTTEIRVLDPTITLTANNWNTGVTVTVQGVDDQIVDGDIASIVSIVVDDAQSDDAFDGLMTRLRAVTRDDDVPATNSHIRGIVWKDENRNGVRDPSEVVLAGAQIYLDANDNGRRDPGERFLPSRDDGSFEFRNVDPGSYVVRQILHGATFQSHPATFLGIDDNRALIFVDPQTHTVRSLGTSAGTPLSSVVMTRNGRVFASGSNTNSLYRINPHAGTTTLVDSWGTQAVEALAYDPHADRLLAVARPTSGSTDLRLYLVNRNDASLTPLGTALGGIQQVGGAAYDGRSDRVVVFDNSDDEFYEFHLNGNARRLAAASASVNSQALAFDGQQFVMQLLQPPDNRQLLVVNPDTGHLQNGPRTTAPIPVSALDHVPFGDTAHRIVVGHGETVAGLKFGQFTVAAGFHVTETGDGTILRESGSSDHVLIALNRRPDFPVVFDVIAEDPTEVSVPFASRRLTFTPEDWNLPQTVTVIGLDDEDPDGNQDSRLLFRVNIDLSDDAFDDLPVQEVSVTTIDDDTPGITVSPLDLIVTESGSSDQFSVVLNAEPNSNVTLDIFSTDTGEATVGPHVITFSRFNWHDPQIITVTGADDILVDGHAETDIVVRVRDGVSDDDYDPLPDQIVSVRTLDNDSTGLYVDRSELTVLESARPDHFHVVLTAAPISNVLLHLTTSDPEEISLSTNTLVFTPENWSRPQKINVTGRSDEVLDGNQQSTITIRVDDEASADAYDNVPDVVLTVTNQDSNFAAMEVSKSLLRVSEDGRTDSFFVRLTAAPLSPVVVSVTSSDLNEATVNPQQLTFTPSNWNIGQNVQVTGVDDLPIDGEQERAIALSIIDSLSDDAFDNAPDIFLRVLNSDNDIAGITLSKKTATVSEAGTTDTFTVVLNTVPSSDVVINVGRQSSGEVVESPFRLTFNMDNWNIPQTVTLRGVDDAVDDGDQTTEIQVAVVASLTDDDYDEVPVQSVIVTTIDNDDGEVKPNVTGPLGRQSASENLTLTWESVPGALSYEVWLERIGAGSANPIANPTVSRLSHTLAQPLPIGRYRTWVRANLAANRRTAWATGRFDVSAAPTFAALPFHADNRTPTIQWTPIPGATSYRLFISNITSQQNGVVDVTTATNTFTVPVDLNFGRHRIWVRAVAADSYAAEWSGGLDYYVGPNLISPITPTFNQRPTFSWQSLPGIATYQLYVQKGANVLINRSDLSATTFTPDADFEPGDYRWWIRPFTQSGRGGAWSRTGRFNVGGRAEVESASVGSNGRLNLQWKTVEGASSYELYLYNDNGRGLVHREAGLTDTQFLAHPLPDGEYRAWIRSYRSDGSPASWSRAHSFELDAAQSSIISTPQSPLTPSFDRRPSFRWSSAQGATSYDLLLTDGTTVIQQNGLTGISWRPSGNLSATRWQWWVRAHSTAGPGPWSPPAATDLSGRVVVLAPNGSTSDRTPTIQWTPVHGASRYLFQLDNVSTSQNAVIRDNFVTLNTFTPTADLTPGTYRAWVQAINGTDNSSAPWSLKFEFTVTAHTTERSSELLHSPLQMLTESLVRSPGPLGRTTPTFVDAGHSHDPQQTESPSTRVQVAAAGDVHEDGRLTPSPGVRTSVDGSTYARRAGRYTVDRAANAGESDEVFDLLMGDPQQLAMLVDSI